MTVILFWLLLSVLVFLAVVGVCTVGEAILNRYRR